MKAQQELREQGPSLYKIINMWSIWPLLSSFSIPGCLIIYQKTFNLAVFTIQPSLITWTNTSMGNSSLIKKLYLPYGSVNWSMRDC